MARKVFFSFHYDDVNRANVVRNSDVVYRKFNQASRFVDKSLWEEAKTSGHEACRRMIDNALSGTSVTCVLIGQMTWSRPWVRYEIMKSFERGNGIIGVNIYDVGYDPKQVGGLRTIRAAGNSPQWGIGQPPVPAPGLNPLDFLGYVYSRDSNRINLFEVINGDWIAFGDLPSFSTFGVRADLGAASEGKLSDRFPVFDWKLNSGYENFQNWVEQAASMVGR